MKLHSLRLENFKGVADRELTFPESGVVVISGPNEVGKTSMIDAFDLLIDYPHTSKHSRVKAAQPVGKDVGVTVEAELTIQDERVRVSRTWLKKPTTQLRFISGRRRGEQLSGDLASDALKTLWGTSDTNLWSALRLMQATGLEQGKELAGSQSLARALQAAAGDDLTEDTGGLIAAAQAEADLYFTPKDRAPKGEFKQAQEALRAAEERLAKAHSDLVGLDECRSSLQRAVDDATRQQELLKAAEEQLARATQARAAVDLVIAEANAAQAALAAAGFAQEQAQSAVKTRSEAVTRAAEAIATANMVEAELAGERDLLAPVDEALAQLATEFAAAEADQTAADEARDVALVAQRRLADQAALARAADLLAQLESLRAQIVELEAAADQPLTQKLVDQLGKAELDLATCQARLADGSPQLTITALGDQRKLLVEGQPRTLQADESWHSAVTAPVSIDLPGLLRVEVAPSAATGLAEAAEDAGTRLAALLAEAKVASVAEARQRLTQIEVAQAELASLKRQRDGLLAGRTEAALLDEHARLVTVCSAPLSAQLPEDAAAADQQVQDASTARDRAREKVNGVTARRQTLRSERDARRARVAELTSKHSVLAEQARQINDALANQRADCPDERLALVAAEAAEQLAAASEKAAGCLRELEELGADQLAADHEDAQARVTGLQEAVGDSRDKECTFTGKLIGLDAAKVQQEADEAETEYELAVARAESISRRATAALRLERTLLAHKQQAQRNYVEPFRAAIVELGARAYSDPEFDVRVEPDLRVSARYLKGTWIDFDALSTGAREQLVILIRLATARLVNPNDRVPVLLDDALGYSDMQRLGRMLRALEGSGDDTQVIVMTANPERYLGMAGRSRVDL